MSRRNFTVVPADKGTSLMQYMVDRGYVPEELIAQLDRGEVLLNGEQGHLHDALRTGDVISVVGPSRDDPVERLTTPPILFEDEALTAYDKPSGVACVGERQRASGGLLAHLRAEAGSDQGPPWLVHRLDKGTSGVWVVARTSEAKKDLTEQFSERQVVKQYRVQVQGRLHEPEGVIEASIGPHPRHPTAMTVDRKGREAVTRYQVLRQYRRFAVVRCWPETGRTHQIRVHMRHLGHPLIHDDLYGGIEGGLLLSALKPGYKKPRNRPERPLISRLTLHCESLELRGAEPATRIRIESPLPKDLARLERNLQNYG